jgi:hypothetical protein
LLPQPSNTLSTQLSEHKAHEAQNNVSQAAVILLVACTTALVDTQQLHIEHQGGVGGDHTASTPLTVCNKHSTVGVSLAAASTRELRSKHDAHVAGAGIHGTTISNMFTGWRSVHERMLRLLCSTLQALQ